MSPGESALICGGADYYYLFKAEEITYQGERVYRVSISNGLHELFPRGIGGSAYLNSAGWCFFAGQSEPTGKSHVYGQDADGLGVWRIAYTAGKGFQFQCVGNDKYISYTMSNSSSADKYYWQCFAEGSLYNAEALKLTPTYAEYMELRTQIEAWVADQVNISCADADREALSEALTKAQEAVDAATSTVNIQSAIDGLRTAGGSFLSKLQLTEGSHLDVTALIANPSFETGTLDGWVAGKPSQGGDVGVKKSENEYETEGTQGFYLFNTWSINDSYAYANPEQYVQQTLNNMPAGEYHLSALASSNTYNSVNAPVELFGNNCVSSFVPQSKLTFKQTYEVTIYQTSSDKNLTIGMRSTGWFRADDFRLIYYGETEAYEQNRRMTTVNLYEGIASQALDRTSYDAVLSQVREALQAKDITDEEITQQNNLLREALMQLVKTGTSATGQFDLTSLLKIQGVQRANNVSALTNLSQTISNMPAGHYTFRANAFYRPAAIADALEMYEAGTEDHPVSIFITRTYAPVLNIFDDARRAHTHDTDILATVDGRSAPTSDKTAMEAFAMGDYPAVVENDLAEDGNLSLGFRIKTPKAADNLFLADNLRLLYGPTPTVSINKTIPAGQLTPLCVPFELKSDDNQQLYCVGSIINGQATIFPVATVHPCEPCVISSTQEIAGFNIPATSVTDKQADITPLPWDGGAMNGDLTNYTWTATSVDGKTVTKAEQLTYTIADPLNMDFNVNLENLQARRFLELEDYNATTSSHITNYNIAPPGRRDQPNNVGIPVTTHTTAKYKLTISPSPLDASPAEAPSSPEDTTPSALTASSPENTTPSAFTASSPENATPSAFTASSPENATPSNTSSPENTTALVLDGFPVEETTLTTSPVENTTLTSRLTDGKLFYIPNLLPQRTYYYEIQSQGTTVAKGKFHTDGLLRMIYAPSIDNVRDLGGWRTTEGKYIRYGRIYRGGELNGSHTATTAAVKRLRNLGITAEIDLRIDYEQSAGKSAFGFTTEAGTFYYANAMDCEPENLTSTEAYARWKAEFELIINTLRKGGNIFFHCRIGADRTGLLSLMLEGLLGVPRDQSNKNYELTSLSPSGLRTRNTQDAFYDYFNGLSGATLQKKFNTFFRQKLGISQADIDEFRAIMLADDPSDAVRDIPATLSTRATTDDYFDLSGRRIPAADLHKAATDLHKGIYIHRGKKLLIK
ncbi:MAG: tyrosine-protein phosphatase [Bacteroidaceae bacterium]|nr:tyrosine-protein phosphatase [Bacteroidaceae bacterium]